MIILFLILVVGFVIFYFLCNITFREIMKKIDTLETRHNGLADMLKESGNLLFYDEKAREEQDYIRYKNNRNLDKRFRAKYEKEFQKTDL